MLREVIRIVIFVGSNPTLPTFTQPKFGPSKNQLKSFGSSCCGSNRWFQILTVSNRDLFLVYSLRSHCAHSIHILLIACALPPQNGHGRNSGSVIFHHPIFQEIEHDNTSHDLDLFVHAFQKSCRRHNDIEAWI